MLGSRRARRRRERKVGDHLSLLSLLFFIWGNKPRHQVEFSILQFQFSIPRRRGSLLRHGDGISRVNPLRSIIIGPIRVLFRPRKSHTQITTGGSPMKSGFSRREMMKAAGVVALSPVASLSSLNGAQKRSWPPAEGPTRRRSVSASDLTLMRPGCGV